MSGPPLHLAFRCDFYLILIGFQHVLIVACKLLLNVALVRLQAWPEDDSKCDLKMAQDVSETQCLHDYDGYRGVPETQDIRKQRDI